MSLRKHPSLPDGYWAKQTRGVWCLFDQKGRRLSGPADAATIEDLAWRDAWCQVDRELGHELAALRAGVRPLEDLRRVRQYLRMLDAVAAQQLESETHPRRIRAQRHVVAAAAAVVAVALVMGPGRPAVQPGPDRYAAPVSATRLRLPRPAVRQRAPSVTAMRAPVVPARVTTTRSLPRAERTRARAAYTVSVGTFTSRRSADRMMHLVRSKGYIVRVVPRGATSQVVTRSYRTRTQAVRVMQALSAIGLRAQVTPHRTP